jgi:hypothetical protein
MVLVSKKQSNVTFYKRVWVRVNRCVYLLEIFHASIIRKHCHRLVLSPVVYSLQCVLPVVVVSDVRISCNLCRLRQIYYCQKSLEYITDEYR